MNIGAKTTNGILFCNFNQDLSCLSVGTRQGYKIYNCDPFGKCYGKQDSAIAIIEMLFSTSLVALVGSGESNLSPRKLQIINTKRQSTICELTFASAVLSVKLNRRRLIVVLEEHIYVYDISNMKLLHTIDTSPNPNALCALSSSSENCYLAYPSISNHGEVLIFDTFNLQAVNIIQAHKSPLSSMQFNADGTMIATASDKGTVIRVFSVPDGEKLHQFRRGTYPARIYSIQFSLDAQHMCVSSDTDTVHIYKLESRSSITQPKTPLSASFFLPESISDMWEPARDFAHAKLPGKPGQNIVALSVVQEQLYLYVATSQGSFYIYRIPQQGGEAVLAKTESMLEAEED
ncbi:WD40-repeat-containing domain protein [Gorgonomyces haynaldii]|nr:WD40-repeat-containing domain protein [Gorgonomyces haynaldii]